MGNPEHVCKGSWGLGTACGYCGKCGDEAKLLIPKMMARIAELEKVRPVVEHATRGSRYEVVGRATLQTSRPLTDYDAMAVYRDRDGELWVRPKNEFEDGRFQPVVNTPDGWQKTKEFDYGR